MGVIALTESTFTREIFDDFRTLSIACGIFGTRKDKRLRFYAGYTCLYDNKDN